MDGGRSLTAMLATSPALAAVGEPLEQIRRNLIAWGQALSRNTDPAYASAVEEAIRYLERQSCRVAVIGQVKAGKSSFINALIGRPGLLPSNVNPWTAVVTYLHFYHAAAAAEGARFSFFEEREWHSIADSGGPLRELTERLVPGFDTQLLSAQLHTMRMRAQARLGPDFTALLGQSHSYPTVTGDILARYVTAGGREGEQGPGWYSDITKSADLYFGGDRTGFPLTLVDTPGTNDPLLVRDEITRQSLATAEIYIVVLTAQQPLSIGDLALLRLLRGLHKDRIVIFINRIDGLRDIPNDTRRVVAHVEARLREEFPGTVFPIIVGSALWANAALAQDAAELARITDAGLVSYAASEGLGRIELAAPGRRPPAETVSTALRASGVPAVLHVVGQMQLRGNAAFAIRQIATFFLQIAQSSEVACQAQVRGLGRALGEARSTSQGRSQEIRRWRTELDQIEAAARELQSNLTLYEGSLRSLVERCASDLKLLLGRCVTGFIDHQVAALTRAYRMNSQAVWSCDSRPLRDSLQAEFIRVYRFWEAKLAQADDFMRSQLNAVVPHERLQSDVVLPQAPGQVAGNAPSIAALSQVVALDLALPWWKAWWAARPTLESRIGELRRIVQGEFDPLIQDLIDEAIATLSERSQHASRQARIGTVDIVNDIHRRSAELVAGLQQAGGGPDSEAISRMEQQLQASEAQLTRWAELKTGLSSLVMSCDILSEPRRSAIPAPPD